MLGITGTMFANVSLKRGKKMGLYHATLDVEALNRLVEANDGELTPEIEQEYLNIEKMTLPDCDRLCAWILDVESDEAKSDVHKKFYTKQKSQRVKLQERLRAKLCAFMKALGKDRIKGEYTATIRQANRPTFVWTGKKPIPKKYTRTIIEQNSDVVYMTWKNGNLPIAKPDKDGNMSEGFVVRFSENVRIS